MFKLMRQNLSFLINVSCSIEFFGTGSSHEAQHLKHVPVMVEEVNQFLGLKNGDTVLDMTFGSGGHSKSLLEKYKNIKIIALDRDPVAHEFAKGLAKEWPGQIIPLLGKFSDLPELFSKLNIGFASLDGIVCDLGASSMQMDMPERGFALSACGPLDMRMDSDYLPNQVTAADVVNYASENQLYKIFKIYGNEKCSRLFARSIVQARYTYKQFKTTKDLAELIEIISQKPRYDKLQRRAHAGTKVFQALRIFVNNEINELNYGLLLANMLLKMGGRIVILTFHSAEDIIVKSHFMGHGAITRCAIPGKYKLMSADVQPELKLYMGKLWYPLNKHVIVPQQREVSENPRCRSAKLRAAVKINEQKNCQIAVQ